MFNYGIIGFMSQVCFNPSLQAGDLNNGRIWL
jgi:hypothetical protein